MKQNNNSDRRQHSRKTCFFAEVDYTAQNDVFTDSIMNISKGGVFIETQAPLNVGEDVTMLFSDLARIDLIRVSGDIVRTMPGGIAVKFDISDNSKMQNVEKFVEKI